MFFNEYSLFILTYIFIVYLFCGIIKGTIGFGMPTVSISLLVFFIDIKILIALILIPTIVVNIYQLSKNLDNLQNELIELVIMWVVKPSFEPSRGLMGGIHLRRRR